MPTSPEEDLTKIQTIAEEKIISFSASKEVKVEVIPVAFGLKSVNLTFVMDESLGSPDALEAELQKIPGVNSAETVDVRRAVG